MRIGGIIALSALLAGAVSPEIAQAQGSSLRLINDRNAAYPPNLIQRVRIVIGNYNMGADASPWMDLGDPANSPGGTFTAEFWVRGVGPENNVGETGCNYDPLAWIACAIVLDRDIMGTPSFGKFGMSICNDGALRTGITTGSSGAGLCAPSANLLNGAWHHIAWTRNGIDGQTCIFVDGVQGDCALGPSGRVSFNDTIGQQSGSGQDPTLVLGAEKHGFGLPYPGFRGWIDEARFSSVVRYAPCTDGAQCFTRPSTPFVNDASTLGLYHFNDGLPGKSCSCAGSLIPLVQGACLLDASGRGTHAECRYGNTGGRWGPQFSAFTPFGPTDSDLDGVPNVSDRCPYAANLLQSDSGGYQSQSADGIGDACQCGDADEDFSVNPPLEVPRMRNTLAGLTPGVVNLAKCSVAGGAADCDILDVAVMRRAANNPPLPPGTAEVCDAAVP